MLKIKEEIDLKELEKFGFKLNEKGQYIKRNTLIYKNRKISGRSDNPHWSKLYIAYELFDIIQAGLVEKVKEWYYGTHNIKRDVGNINRLYY